MIDALLLFYQMELKKIRELGVYFSEAHPGLANRLKLSPHSVEDPFVGRLFEGMAFLTAYLQHRLTHQVEPMSRALLNLTCPNFDVPVPSMMIVQFHPVPSIKAVHELPQHLKIGSALEKNGCCHFRTAYSVLLMPLEINDIHFFRKDLNSSLLIHLKTLRSSVKLHQINLKKLRFFISHVLPEGFDLYEMIFNHTIQIDLFSIQSSGLKVLCPLSHLKKVGFDEPSLLPTGAHEFSGYALLKECAIFPQKFLFFDLELQSDWFSPEWGDAFNIQFFFKSSHDLLEKNVHKNSLALGCVPAVNLFEQMGEPIRLAGQKIEYRVVPDVNQKPESMEVYQVQSVDLFSEDDQKVLPCYPYFGRKFSDRDRSDYFYWQLSRKVGWEVGLPHLKGFEVFLSMSAFGRFRAGPQALVAIPKLWCTNRDEARSLPVSQGRVSFYIAQGSEESVESVHSLTPMTAPYYQSCVSLSDVILAAHLKFQKMNWELPEKGLDCLKELLAMYGFSREVLDSLVSLHAKKIMRRHESFSQAFCRGLEMELKIDPSRLRCHSAFLLGLVLQAFFSQCAGVNSFVVFSRSP